MSVRERIIDIATEQIGIVEQPQNKVKYNQWYGNGLENGGSFAAWCATFVSYIYHFAGHPLGKIDHDEGFSYVPTLFHRAKQKRWITTSPKPGDIVIFDWNGDSRHDHTGIFVEMDGNKVICIEGNTSPDHRGNQSNGGGVYKRIRDKKFCTFINVIDKV